MSDVHVHVRVQVCGEDYAFPIEDVLEVVELGDVTPVPGAPRSAMGVRNLRGQVLPVFDLASVLGLSADGPMTRIVVADDGERHVGLAVDQVVDVAALAGTGEDVESPFLTGAVLADGAFVGVLDIVAVMRALEAETGP